MKSKIIFIIIIVILIAILIVAFIKILSDNQEAHKGGVVPDEETATKIAEAIWLSIYGERIYNRLPFKADYNEKDDCWIVTGTLPENWAGGVPEIKIRKSDCKIIYIRHGK